MPVVGEEFFFCGYAAEMEPRQPYDSDVTDAGWQYLQVFVPAAKPGGRHDLMRATVSKSEAATHPFSRVCFETADAAHILGMRRLCSAGHNMQTLAAIERLEARSGRANLPRWTSLLAAGALFDKLEQEVTSWVYQAKLAA